MMPPINRPDWSRTVLWFPQSDTTAPDNHCLNPSCRFNNVAYRTTCVRCGSTTTRAQEHPTLQSYEFQRPLSSANSPSYDHPSSYADQHSACLNGVHAVDPARRGCSYCGQPIKVGV